MKFKILISNFVLAFAISNLYSQLVVNSGVLSVDSGTVLSLENQSLIIDGNISMNKSSTLVLSNTVEEEKIIGGNTNYFLSNLTLKGNWSLETTIYIDERINLENSLLDIKSNQLWLMNGHILNESDDNRIFSSGTGEIMERADLIAGISSNPGNIGITITSDANESNVEIRRGHQINNTLDKSSVERYYVINELSAPAVVEFSFLEPEQNNLDIEKLVIWNNTDNSWVPLLSSEFSEENTNIKALLTEGKHFLTLFEYESSSDITIPNGISPNNDQHNDILIIGGLEAYPNNRFVVFNKWSDVIYEAEPYDNSWGGENVPGYGIANSSILPDGTYYYLFFKDKNEKTSVISGYIEIKAGK
ncbi:MAG: gliding motility-associated C-terminal domain-containing protein [Bacteroidales bacterium]|nr:gliding motility-associated C-terminal domain-containing protein [Bacteroidales bacterium]MBN2821241.1 gliding motility-associated C-terminal domain-containing protein [Bacteroidales bacterium]